MCGCCFAKITLKCPPPTEIFIAGHRGLVGSALTRKPREKGLTNLVHRTRQELDLTNQQAVEVFFADEKPDNVAADTSAGSLRHSSVQAVQVYAKRADQRKKV
jgi:GDP-L-fucose synthase